MSIVYFSHINSYNHYTWSFAIRELAELLNVPLLVYDVNSILTNQIQSDLNVELVIFEGFIGRGPFFLTTDQIKKWFPYCKIIAVGSHTLNCNNYIEYNTPFEVDLHLDTSSKIVTEYRKRGIPSELIIISATKSILEYIGFFKPLNKVYDLICLVSGMGKERIRMLKHLQTRLKSLSNLKEHHIDNVCKYYLQTWVALGTTTPSCDLDRNGKGFRDWIAPMLGVVLIHDDFPAYYTEKHELFEPYSNIVPSYSYGKFNEIISLVQSLKQNRNLYEHLLISQKNWAVNNTVEKQLFKAIQMYGILSSRSIWL